MDGLGQVKNFKIQPGLADNQARLEALGESDLSFCDSK
jgi:hypothetical protein